MRSSARSPSAFYAAMEDRLIDLPAGKRVHPRTGCRSSPCSARPPIAGKLPKPLLDRFGFVWQLRSYTLPEMSTIVALDPRTSLGVTNRRRQAQR